MARTVFWSWQSDRSERETRSLIREAIVKALDALASESEIEDRIEIDHDTKGLPGSPDIVASILAKIDAASVFVADVTPVAVSDSGKQVANPNVLIELGYAKKSLGTQRVITVWNTAFCDSKIEDLPFDLRGRRGPISYALLPGAAKEELRSVRESLRIAFADRLRGCIESAAQEWSDEVLWYPSIEGDQSIWIEPNKEFTINEGWGSGKKFFREGGRWYVRVIPATFDEEVLQEGTHGPFMNGYGGFSWGHTREGLLTYSGSVRADVPKDLDAASLWLRPSGELWMFQNGVSAEWRGINQFFGDHIAEKWIEFAERGLAALEAKNASGPYHIRFGVTGLEGTHWPQNGPSFGANPPEALEAAIEYEFRSASSSIEDWQDGAVEAWRRLRAVFSVRPPLDTEVAKVFSK